jgi:phosphate starvation-inducible PhoH-like protein
MTKRRNKKLSDEEILDVNNFINRKQSEEEKIFNHIKIDIKPKTENQKKLVESIKNNEIIIASGLPGTGKTFLACAEALKLIKNPQSPYQKVILVKSVTTLKDEDIGFLKGTMEEKMEPFMDSFLDNFNKIIGESSTTKLRDLGFIQIKPIAYVRGRSIDKSVIIIDEAQNVSLDNMRTLMTRIGENSKLIILGDVKQKDIRNKKESSLEVVIERFKGKTGFGTVELRNEEDIVRNPIIKVIEDIFDQIEEEKINNNGKKVQVKDYNLEKWLWFPKEEIVRKEMEFNPNFDMKEFLADENSDNHLVEVVDDEITVEDFVYDKCCLEIFGYADEIVDGAVQSVNDLELHLKMTGKEHKMIITSREAGRSVPSTLFFLSKTGCMIQDIKFTMGTTDCWEFVDIMVTDHPEILNSKPEGKKVIKIEKPFNQEIPADYTVKSVRELIGLEIFN